MKCPNDQATLLITERQNIEIDYCPECRGVWLDRGELDKLIERSPSGGSYQEHAPIQRSQGYRTDDQYHKRKKKESFLGDLFDF